MGRVLGGIRLAGVLLSASVLPHSFLSASKIFRLINFAILFML